MTETQNSDLCDRIILADKVEGKGRLAPLDREKLGIWATILETEWYLSDSDEPLECRIDIQTPCGEAKLTYTETSDVAAIMKATGATKNTDLIGKAINIYRKDNYELVGLLKPSP